MRTLFRIIALVAILSCVPVLAFSANGDTINIGGQVPLVLTLTVTPTATSDNLTLLGSATTTVAIATIDITTNNTAGWELWVFSANASGATTSMINADSDAIAYTITYAGAGGVGTTDIPDTGLLVGESAANATQTTQDLSVTYDQTTTYPAGYYSDQLSIVLRAK